MPSRTSVSAAPAATRTARSARNPRLIVTIADASEPGTAPKSSTALLGGKAARLAEMTAAGLPVPPGFCITTELFDQYLADSGLAGKIQAMDPSEARDAVMCTDLPQALADAITTAYRELGSPRVAVRSSARKEDSATHSFAGQHDTVLDVAGDQALLDAVKTCWASLWSPRAAAYRLADRGAAGSIAVLVQQMVPADVSGVLFTADPVSPQPHRMIVEACHGLGEGLVSGRVSSDFFALDDRSMEPIEERIRYKVTKCAPIEPGRIGMTKVEGAARSAPCLTRAQLRDLCSLAVRVRSHYGSEQDIEWALHDEKLYLLQARPITTRPVAAVSRSPFLTRQPDAIQRGTLWSRMDIGEIFVGQMTPLGVSFARHHQKYVHGHCAAAVGVRDTGDYVGYMGYLNGHVYLNVSYTSYLLGQCLPTRDQRHFTARFVSEEVDLSRYRNPYGTFPGGMEDLKSTTHWIKYTATELVRMKQRCKQLVASRLFEFDRARGIDLSRLTRRELHAELERYLEHYHDMHVGYMPYYINAFGAYGLMTELCAKWLGSAGENLQNRIKTDMSNLRTVASAREIWSVAQAARQRPGVMKIIRESPLEHIEAALRDDRDGAVFWDRHMEPFLRANGTRSQQEMELTHPRWIDDPSYLFQMIRRYAEDGLSIDDILKRNRADGEEDATAVLRTLPRAKRTALEKIIALYANCSELRETARMSMVTSLWLIRNVIYEVARRLIDEGVLYNADEVAFLEFDDIRGFLAGGAPAREVFDRATLDETRRMYEHYKRQPEPPLSFIGEYDPAEQARPAADGPQLIGLGASPGRVTGRARIIEDLVWQADEFQPGEILVTRYTDASWTPLFAIAGAVVTDIGSMLSHSSIVSREFNVPSVVNTKNATQRINTGDTITVDGDGGLVEIIEA